MDTFGKGPGVFQVSDAVKYKSGWIESSVDGLWAPDSHYINRSDLQIPHAQDPKHVNRGPSYNVSQATVDAIGNLFLQTFSSTNNGGNDGVYNATTGLSIIGFELEADFHIISDPPALLAFYNTSSPEAIFQNLARSITNAIRMAADNGTFVTGNVTRITPCFDIQRYWLIYPSVLIISGMVFLGLCMLETHKTRTPVWKTSSLALLFHGLDGETMKKLREPPESESGMKRGTRGLEMRLQGTKDGLKLVVSESAEEKEEKIVSWRTRLRRGSV